VESADDTLLFLAGPAGWLVRLVAFLRERVASAMLSLLFPVAALIGELHALPGVAGSNISRAAFGLRAPLPSL
jgi:seipin